MATKSVLKAPPKLKAKVTPKGAAKRKRLNTMALFLDEVASVAKVSSKDSEAVLEAFRRVVAKELRKKGALKLPSFLHFRVKTKPERQAKMTRMFGKEMLIPAKPPFKGLKATPLKPFKDIVLIG